MERSQSLAGYSVFAAMLGMAGIPLYIFAPKFFVDTYGASLATIGVVLFVLRLLDFVQDPILGWLADRLGPWKPVAVFVSIMGLIASIFGLFVVVAPFNAITWFSLCMILLFSTYSLLTVLFYASGVSRAALMSNDGHVRLAAWRETGTLIGICIACIIPFAIEALFPNTIAPFLGYAVLFAVLGFLALWMMRAEWGSKPKMIADPQTSIMDLLRDATLRRLLLITFLNAAPVAITSTLFLFFVEYRLGSALAAGPLLLLFFISAAISVPFWTQYASKRSAKTTLLMSMALSILVFAFAYALDTGQIIAFGIVCILSGATLGADMVLLPALFAKRVAATQSASGRAFGLWSFCTKATLAIAAVTVLPLLENAGFTVGSENAAPALNRLSLLYALVPCALKSIAFFCLFQTQLEDA